ncbi:MAG: hypothetical protein EOO04_30275, partial [Chitinophagaceae bacterium]
MPEQVSDPEKGIFISKTYQGKTSSGYLPVSKQSSMSASSLKDFYGSRNYLLLSCIFAIPVWIAVIAYVSDLNVP